MSASRQIATRRRELSTTQVGFTACACLFVGHLAINAIVPSVAVNIMGVGLVGLILGYVLFVRRDSFSFLLIVFVCSGFRYANNQGGLFNLVTFFLLASHLLINPVRETMRSRDSVIVGLMFVLIVSNMIGLIVRNPMPLNVRILEACSFNAFMLAFYVAGNLRLTDQRLKKLLYVLSGTVIYGFLVSINQHYAIVGGFNTPLLGFGDNFYAASNAFGTFQSASSNGQYSMIIFAFLMPLLCASASRSRLRLKPIFFVLVAILCMSNVVLSNMRAAAVESFMLLIIYSAMFTVMYRRSFKNSKYLNVFTITLVFFMMSFGVLVGTDNMIRDFEEVEIESIGDVVSGRAINRGSWTDRFDRMLSESWWIGYAHGVSESNQIAAGAQKLASGRLVGGGHLHNLYMALPILYGWFGGVAYLGLFIVTVTRLLSAVKKFSFDRLLVVVCLSFLMSLVFFLLDEFKSGNAVQYINYPMIVWIWLGFALSAVRTLRLELVTEHAKKRSKKAEPFRSDTVSAEFS
jgi:hypothetical protein